MNEKRALLANMNRLQLIKIIGAEKARLAKREIHIDPSSDNDILRQDLEKLNLRTIRKHAQKLGVALTQEQMVKDSGSRKDKRAQRPKKVALKPPSRYVRTVRDLIYWLYAGLIARSAGFAGNYGFVISRYRKLKSGEMQWSPTMRDYQKDREKGNVCTYCGAPNNLSADHIIPISRAGVDPRVRTLLNSADNCVLACKTCNSSKGARDVFEWYGEDRIDELPSLVLSKFLKLSYKLHETQGTLDLKDPNTDGVLDIYDLGVVITHLISRLSGEAGKTV